VSSPIIEVPHDPRYRQVPKTELPSNSILLPKPTHGKFCEIDQSSGYAEFDDPLRPREDAGRFERSEHLGKAGVLCLLCRPKRQKKQIPLEEAVVIRQNQ
jgi:hypothetical protein